MEKLHRKYSGFYAGSRKRSEKTCFLSYSLIFLPLELILGFPGSQAGEESTCKAGDLGSISGSGRSLGEGIGYPLQYSWISLVAQTVKNSQCGRPGFNPWVGKIPWRKAWKPTPVFLPGESPWTEEPGGLQSMGRKESDTTE